MSQVYEDALASSLALGNVVASPTLDCNRIRGKSTPSSGTLYIATSNGYLVALIVDSHGLDPTAAWPKYQHDASNTGNSTNTQLNPGCN
jgi:hypothetical protein